MAIEFNLLSEFLRPALKTNQIAKNCTQDTLKKEPIFIGCKMSELFEKSPLQEAEKHPDFGVTLCRHFVSTDVKFFYVRSEIIPIFCNNLNISQKYFTSIGFGKR
ncbi:MAG: hypothetical protein ACYS6K_04275 [Planctomycetota bacterium]